MFLWLLNDEQSPSRKKYKNAEIFMKVTLYDKYGIVFRTICYRGRIY